MNKISRTGFHKNIINPLKKIVRLGSQIIFVNLRLIVSMIESEPKMTSIEKTRDNNNPSNLTSPTNDNPIPRRTDANQIAVNPCSRGSLNPSLSRSLRNFLLFVGSIPYAILSHSVRMKVASHPMARCSIFAFCDNNRRTFR